MWMYHGGMVPKQDIFGQNRSYPLEPALCLGFKASVKIVFFGKKLTFFGLPSALDFIHRFTSLRSVPLGIKSPALLRPSQGRFFTLAKQS